MFRENTDHLIGTFSEALKIMDHNATLYMIDEMQKEIDEKTQELDAETQELDEKNQELANNKELLAKYETLLREHGITL